ncbi:Cytochrome c oxidase assembly protein cox19 [Recurvomyces mirabilis]|nr:Cytochrome c oxidase assembly protein cox19 [Recurvomyces mirabilis]
MSTFGGPGGRQIVSKPSPPERGSFPLDHDAECQPIMKQYLRCIRSFRGVNDDECRHLSKSYLQCRMDRNLMAPDSMKNLGFQDLSKSAATTAEKSATSTDEPSTSTKK